MLNLSLYALTVLIWGTTWIAIKLQLGSVAVEASIMYRFILAGGLMFIGLILLRKLQKISLQDHLFCVLQGACLFCFNFYAMYTATGYISSGLVAVIFSLATVFNSFNNWIWFKKRPTQRVVWGALLGLIGIGTMFFPEIQQDIQSGGVVKGILLAMLGTYFFSSGNMVSVRHQMKGLKTPLTNAWSILYGVCIMFVLIQFQEVPLTFSWEASYVLALLYLAIPGTVIAFTTYLMLVGRIGPDRAAYSTVMFPAVALTVSTFVEGYQWTDYSVIGFIFVLSGNVLIFTRWAPKAFNAGTVSRS